MFTKHNGTRLLIIGAVLFTLVGVLAQSFYKLQTPLLRADFISTLVPGIAPFRGMGSPYLDYWEIRPPALPMMTGLWGAIFGSSLWSFHLLWLIFLVGIMRMVWLILGRLFTFSEKILLYGIFGLLFFAQSVQTQFFPPEINGLFFSLLGLLFVLKEKPTGRDFFFGSFFFILAGQMKEVFALAGLTLVPHLLIALTQPAQQLWRFLKFTVTGVGTAAAIIFVYLLSLGSLPAYGELIQYKSQIFSPTNVGVLAVRLSPALNYLSQRFIGLPYKMLFLFTGSAAALFFWIQKDFLKVSAEKGKQLIQFIVPKQHSQTVLFYSLAVFYCLGSFLGYLMQDRYNHIYDIAILLPFVLAITLSGKILLGFLFSLLPLWFRSSLVPYLPVVTLLVLGVLLLPKKQFFIENLAQLRGYDPRLHAARWLNAEDEAHTAMERKIRDNTSESDCIDVQHGWNVGQQYYYSKRRPCTRFFLTNILPATKVAEYQAQLITNPPAALVYITVLTDLDVENFENTIFHFSRVIENCFIQDDQYPTLYWPASEGETFQQCFATGLPEQVQ